MPSSCICVLCVPRVPDVFRMALWSVIVFVDILLLEFWIKDFGFWIFGLFFAFVGFIVVHLFDAGFLDLKHKDLDHVPLPGLGLALVVPFLLTLSWFGLLVSSFPVLFCSLHPLVLLHFLLPVFVCFPALFQCTPLFHLFSSPCGLCFSFTLLLGLLTSPHVVHCVPASGLSFY